jgi:hypothetical protein
MSRKPHVNPAAQESRLVELDPEVLAQDRTAANTLATLQAGQSAERDLVNQLLGQAQMADAFSQFSRTVRISKLAYVKENKLYQQLRGMKTPHGAELEGTWESFCKLLGTSVDQADRDIANLQAFGEEALQSMSNMGIGYRDLRQFRKLPDDAKPLLIEAAKAGDKAAFLDLAEELVVRHSQQKQALEAKLQAATDSLEAKDQVLKAEMETVRQLQEEKAHPWKPNPRLAARSAEEEAALMVLQARADGVAQEAQALAVVVADLCERGDGALHTKALQAMNYVVSMLRQVVLEHGLEVEVSDDALGVQPAWMSAEWQPGSAAE